MSPRTTRLIGAVRVAAGALTTAGTLTAASAAQSDVPQIALATPVATVDEPFSSVAGLRVLSDGRLLVADPTEQALWHVDPMTRSREQLGRQGQGPGEYEMPAGLFAIAGDSTLMMDRLNRRLTVVLPDGRLSTSTIPLRLPTGLPVFPRGTDRQGRIYFDLAGIQMPGLEEAASSGRAPLLRWDPATGAVDTLGYVSFPPMPGSIGPGEMRVSIGGSGPYSGRDEWAVGPDGQVGIARYREYHIEWLPAEGNPVVGPTMAYDPVKIGRAEKEAWADQVARNGLIVEVENGRRRVGRPPRPDIDGQEFPEVMPPFLSGAVSISPAGELWVARARGANALERRYDVFDTAGKLVRQVTLPGDRRVVGFADGSVYVVRVDEDDLEWLEEYRTGG